MAADAILAKAFYRRKTKGELETALDALLNTLTEPDDIVNQYLEGEGWTMKVKSMSERRQMIETIESALEMHEGKVSTPTGAHSMNFSTREIE